MTKAERDQLHGTIVIALLVQMACACLWFLTTPVGIIMLEGLGFLLAIGFASKFISGFVDGWKRAMDKRGRK